MKKRALVAMMVLACPFAACDAVLGIDDYEDRVADGGAGSDSEGGDSEGGGAPDTGSADSGADSGSPDTSVDTGIDSGLTAGIGVAAPLPGNTTSEVGAQVTVAVVLRSPPTANVTIPLSVSKPGEAMVDPAQLVFTASNWNVAQTITVTGKDDVVDDGDQAYSLVLGAAVSTDVLYAGMDPADVSLVNVDDDTAGFVVSAAAPDNKTTEAGGQISFTVKLRSQPSADVTLPVSSTKTAEGTPNVAQLVFTAGNWYVAQTITVTGKDDFVDDGDQAYSIALGAASSPDVLYAGMDPGDVALTNVDDDAAGLVVSAPAAPNNKTSESGAQITFTVKLQSQPVADVTVPVASTKTAEGKPNKAQLVFTAGTWNVAQTVTVTGQADGVVDGDQSYNASLGASTSADPLYAALSASVPLVNVDTPACVIGTATYSDISAGQGAQSGMNPSAMIDAANGKLLVATENGANSIKPGLFRCNLDGTACTYSDISAGQAANSGYYPFPVLDAANGKLLVVTQNNANSVKAGLFRCDLDGLACAHSDISAGQGAYSGEFPSALIDAAAAKLLVVTANYASIREPALFRCNLDGTACTYTDISAGQGAWSGVFPSAMIDAANGKLLVVTMNLGPAGANADAKPALFRCDLDGSACVYSDISAGQAGGSGWYPSAVLDAANGKLIVVTANTANSNKPALFRCNLDGSGCTYADISTGQGANSAGIFPSAVIDAASGKLLVVTQNDANAGKPALFRCNLDGTGCTYHDISAGQGASSGLWPYAVLDAANGRLLVVTRNDANGGRPALFSVCAR